jgi:glycosyltransferase involved in cell wall biosynthesis
MRTLLIHALGATMGGAVRHLSNFLPELGKQDVDREYTVLVRESFPSLGVSNNIRLERIPDRACASWLKRISGDVLELPQRLKREKFSAVVSLTNFGPIWSPVPHIFFQRNAVYYSPYYLETIHGRLKIETALRRRLAVASMMRADLIVTPSHAMGEMIREACPQTQNRRFHTLYHGFSMEALADPLDEKFARLLAREKRLRLLYPTHPERYKGFEVLFDILSKLKAARFDCCLFAPISVQDWPEGVRAYERQVKQLGLEDNVVFMGRVPQRQMGALYEQCDLMVYPSLCESFGFSMIEAMGHSVPIVASDTAINREMCGGAALFYPPLDAAAGAKAIQDAVEPAVMEKLREAGRMRVASFDWGWRRYAREFVDMVGMVS